ARVARVARDPAARSRDRIGRFPRRSRRQARLPVLAPGRAQRRALPRGARGVQRTEAAMSRPVVLVIGAEGSDSPPGIEDADPIAELRTVESAAALDDAIVDAEAIFSWRARKAWLEAAWPKAG